MRSFLFQVILISLAILHISGGTAIKVMTYNIRMDFEGDKEDNWKHRKDDMVRYIQSHQPDFIGVQEALYSQLFFLDEALENYSYLGVGRDDGDKAGEFMALFYLSEKWKVALDSTFWLSEIPEIPTKGWDAACFRVCTYGVFENHQGKSIAVFNTHFDHQGKVARKNSVAVLESFIRPYLSTYPVILTGDFNVEPGDEVYTEVTAFLNDTRNIAKEREENSSGTFNSFRLEGPFDRRIDYIFVNHLVENIDKYQVQMPRTSAGRQVSDHFPVIVELEIK